MQALHVGACVVGVFFGTAAGHKDADVVTSLHLIARAQEEWAVILEIAALMAFEAGVIIEGLSLDVFGMSEELARQASSTVLAVFTISCAVGVTIGGLIYDFFGWQGMSVFHTGCAGVLLLLFIFQPTCRVSFYEYFWPMDFEDGE